MLGSAIGGCFIHTIVHIVGVTGVNVYDFDNTIYDGDSSVDFYVFCLKRHPSILGCLPRQIRGAIMYGMGRIPKVHFKEIFFCFLQKLENTDEEVDLFWGVNEKQIKGWYHTQQKCDDLVISASPFFLLKNICDRLQIKYLIASPVNSQTGKFEGHNCYGEEKVTAFLRGFPGLEIDNFYTDSVSDAPLAALSHSSYLVKRDKVTLWDPRDTIGTGGCV